MIHLQFNVMNKETMAQLMDSAEKQPNFKHKYSIQS